MNTLTYVGVLSVHACYCGIHFAMPEELFTEHRRTGVKVFCPLGHSVRFGESTIEQENERLKARLNDEHTRTLHAREDAEHQRRRLNATKGVLTKTKKRIANGVCPCCQRTFVALGRHMANQHPDYIPENPNG